MMMKFSMMRKEGDTLEIKVSDYLLHGQGNARNLDQLTDLTGLSGRTITRLIELERQCGIPICAANTSTDGRKAGYWLATDSDELIAYCKRRWKQLNRELKTIGALNQTARTLEGQTEIDVQQA